MQYNVERWRFPDRTTQIGQMINSYLKGETETDDAAMHLLFSANRWEKRYPLVLSMSDKRSMLLVIRIYVNTMVPTVLL